MASFLEKLKKGMGVEISEELEKESEEELEKTEEKVKPVAKKRKPVVKKRKETEEEMEIETKSIEKEVEESEMIEIAEENKKAEGFALENLNDQEGQLAIDVYQTNGELVIQSAIAGVKPENLDISIEDDMISIRGNREKPAEKSKVSYFYQECYWGPFSRQIILPEEVDPSRAEASMKEGILTIRIPKIDRKRKRKIEVKG